MIPISKFRAVNQAPLPFEAAIRYEDYPTTRIAYTPPNEITPRKKRLPFAPDASDKERLIRVLVGYERSCDASSLHIHDEDRHTMASQVLCGDLSSSWEMTIADAPNTNDAHFVTNARAFLKKYMLPNAFHIQEQYLRQITKPVDMDCFEAASRLRLINKLSVYLPGSGGKKLFRDDASLKSSFYRIMPSEWQTKFDSTGSDLYHSDYNFNKLVNFMETTRLHDSTVQGNKRLYDNSVQENKRRKRDYPQYHDHYQPHQEGFQDNGYDTQNNSNGHDNHYHNHADPNGYYNAHYHNDRYNQSFDQHGQYDRYNQSLDHHGQNEGNYTSSNQYGQHDRYSPYDRYDHHDGYWVPMKHFLYWLE